MARRGLTSRAWPIALHSRRDSQRFRRVILCKTDRCKRAIRARRDSSEKPKGRKNIMSDPHAARARLNRRGLLKRWRGDGGRRLRAAPGAGAGRHSRSIRRHVIQARRARTKPQIGRRAAHGHHQPPAAFRPAPVGHVQQSRLDGLHVRQPDPPRSARRRQGRSSPTWRIAGRSPRTARPIPSICARACSSTTAPS